MRYFYTDRLAAGIMATKHDFKFKSAKGQQLYWDGGDFRTNKDCGVYGGEKYYIHSDCHKMLKPQLHDLVEFDGIIFGLVLGSDDVDTCVQCDDVVYTPDTDECTIIQRNEEAWFTPESEE